MKVETTAMAGQQTGTVYFYVRDHLGNSRLVLDVDGNIQSRFNYEPYGVELTPLGSNTTNEKYKFTGQERDYDTGMDYMHFRYYASSMGRFMKPDNMITNAMNPQSWNLYSYVNNSPINANDPTGHDDNLPHGTKISREAPSGGSVWDMLAGGGVIYDESVFGGSTGVAHYDWPSSSESYTEPVGQEDQRWAINTVFTADPFTGLTYGNVSTTQFSEYQFDLSQLASLGEARGIEIGFSAPSLIENKGFHVKADIGVTFGTLGSNSKCNTVVLRRRCCHGREVQPFEPLRA